MTTNIIVKAHCDAKRKQVKIETYKTDGDITHIVESNTIQDGEEYEVVVYDDLFIKTYEELKPIPPTPSV